DLTADRKAQARAAVPAAGRAVGLLEGLEDQPELVVGDADSGVDHREGHHSLGFAQRAVEEADARRRGVYPQRDVAVLGELDRVREQVPQDLLEPLLVGL